MKLSFNVSSVEAKNFPQLSKLMTEVSKFKCRVQIDFENSVVNAELSNSDDIDNVIDIVNNFFDIRKVDIINDESVHEDTEAEVDESSKAELETSDKQSVSEENIPVKPMQFYDPDIKDSLNRLAKASYWLLKGKDVESAVICKRINSAKKEMGLNYDGKNSIDFSIGDVVDTYYGEGVKGEISGTHIQAIVVNILGDSAYLIPLTDSYENAEHHMEIESGKDIIYAPDARHTYPKSIALLDMGRYISSKRVNSVIGQCSSSFFSTLIEVLPEAFCFNDLTNESTTEIEKKGEGLSNENSQETSEVPKSSCDKSNVPITQLLRDYIMQKETFTIKELKEHFDGEIERGSISNFLYWEKKKGLIISTENRGEYRVVRK